MKKQYLVSNHSFIQRSIKGLVIPPYAKDIPVSESLFNELKLLYPNILKYKVVEGEEIQQSQEPEAENAPQKGALTLVAELELSASVNKALQTAQITEISQLTEMTSEDVIAVKGIAEAGLNEIVAALNAIGLTLKEGE
ncbi:MULTISPECIES: DNA-directed RNA polymerase subunit alpha C-terminal domain-containing protein [Vibrio]|uniref:DNA-directed RNA polymerase subunit alpha C-terminal domain-containing protein n=1 Tax=Vibrio TaxID=662 RepID=UPI0029656F0E|nr:DNA-directed RNA polymerase subunit alpha C-terminal domain-containing protein [Vibrio sp. 1078-1]MDW2371416.1 DNA-directed RNA polymerase subunit alpha C-terminal domain-containing protein [Vibrio sp. 1078-1]